MNIMLDTANYHNIAILSLDNGYYQCIINAGVEERSHDDNFLPPHRSTARLVYVFNNIQKPKSKNLKKRNA